ncbi:MAG TPA: TusE/DsrC/DsvC family sulfur relay protein [Gammaproteobacteria bacterium]
MRDIGKYISDQGAIFTDPAGYMAELEPWDERIAEQRASELGITMTEQHWEVVRFLRHHYQCNGPVPHARNLVEDMDTLYAEQGGRRYLYTLFPRGPVVQGTYIAGLPVPPGAIDRNFGSVE